MAHIMQVNSKIHKTKEKLHFSDIRAKREKQ